MNKYVTLFLLVFVTSYSIQVSSFANSTNQTITGTIGVVLSIELTDEDGNVVSENLGFGDLTFQLILTQGFVY
jgi:hypothetical protein